MNCPFCQTICIRHKSYNSYSCYECSPQFHYNIIYSNNYKLIQEDFCIKRQFLVTINYLYGETFIYQNKKGIFSESNSITIGKIIVFELSDPHQLFLDIEEIFNKHKK